MINDSLAAALMVRRCKYAICCKSLWRAQLDQSAAKSVARWIIGKQMRFMSVKMTLFARATMFYAVRLEFPGTIFVPEQRNKRSARAAE